MSTQKSILPTGLVVDNIYAIDNDFVNWFVVKSKTGYIAVDAGYDNDKSKAELAKLSIQLSDIKAVILTHDHQDHFTGLSLFDKSIPVYGKVANKCNLIVKDDETLDIDGVSVTIVNSAGHKADQICPLIDGNHLITADTFYLFTGDKVVLANKHYDQDSEQRSKDITRIAKLQVQTVITSHSGYSSTPDYSDFV
jgi:glyoxylase-like metal-dependent hydrolase (beta-lactamase superfamily II)